MSAFYPGFFNESSSEVLNAIAKQLDMLNLKPVTKVEVEFDPFHPKAFAARDFLCYLSSKKVRTTNLSCEIKTNVVCNQSEPKITVYLGEAGTLIYLVNDLTILEILQNINYHIAPLLLEEPDIDETVNELGQAERKKE